MHVSIMACNLAQREALCNTFTCKISLINHEKLSILFPRFNFFAFQTPSPSNCHLNTRALAGNNGIICEGNGEGEGEGEGEGGREGDGEGEGEGEC